MTTRGPLKRKTLTVRVKYGRNRAGRPNGLRAGSVVEVVEITECFYVVKGDPHRRRHPKGDFEPA